MFDLLNTLSNYAPLLPVAAGSVLWKRLDRSSRIVMVLLLCATFSQLFSRFNFGKPYVWPIFNTYIFLDLALWTLVFYTNSRNRIIRTAIMCLYALHAILFLYVAIFVSFAERFLTEFVCFNCLLQLTWVLLFLYERYKTDAVRTLEFDPLFWYSLGLLLYSPTTYFLFAFYDIVRGTHGNTNASLWAIHNVMNILMYTLIFVGMTINTRTEKTVKLSG